MECFLVRNGGGAPLNFKVVGNPKPTNPKENTIWVNTDQKITSWHFGTEEPNVYDIQPISDTDPWHLVAPHKLSEGDILNFIIPANVTNTFEAIRIYDPFTGKMYCVREYNGTAMQAWPSGLAVGVIISNDLYQVGDWVGHGTARLLKWGTFYHAEGTLWISTGVSSPGAFNALKKNGILLNPTSAKQYINGAWADKPAEICHNGEWVSWIVYLIKQGVDQISVSGGWETKAVPIYSGGNGHVGVAPTITVKDGYIEFKEPGYTASAYSGLAHARNKIDLTGISKIKIYASGWYYKATDYCTAAISVWKSIGSAGVDNRVANVVITDLKEYILDVSGLSGEHYIGVTVVNAMNGQSSYVNIYDLSYE